MYEELGKIIRGAREQLALEQGELASRLGIGQQAVSTWERGKSRPRRSMLSAVAGALQVDESRLLEAGGYLAADGVVRLAARPLARCLPLEDLPPERFEDLVTEIIHALHPSGHATRYGGPGEKQFGIDVLVVGDEGTLATAQCKRHKEFGPASVKNAVEMVTIEAPRHYLFLSRLTATPGARSEMANHPGWELWDGEDISRFVRSTLQPDRALRLVDSYFPGHREAFLGVRHASPWLPPEDIFVQPSGQFFSHDWALVGREAELATLSAGLFDQTRSLAVLLGRGGTGKTRMLRALAEASSGAHVVILQSGVAVNAADVELLPTGPLVVLIDDAHERDDIAHVVAGIWRRNTSASILIAARPYGWSQLRSDLARAALLPDEPILVELGDLTTAAAEELARQALGAMHEVIVQRLARLTLDCPLATVVGGLLIQRGELDPMELEHDEGVREAIMRGFHDALVADPVVLDPDTRMAVLDAVAAIQPLRPNEQAFKDALVGIVGKPYEVLVKHLRSLEDAGILRRRDMSLRITPDLLGDVILSRACYGDRAYDDTGYLDRVRSCADASVLQHLFVNVSRVDWQVRQRVGASPSLADRLWRPLEEEIKEADIQARVQLVKLLAKVAGFQPSRVLKIGRWLVDNPTDRVSEEGRLLASFGGGGTYQDVLNAMPPMLKGAAYTFESLPTALGLLWELAQSDDRPTNQYPDHPMRVLRDLAEFEVGKPGEYNDAIVDSASAWFSDGQTVTPFDVLEPLLATEGSRRTYQDYSITFQPFALNVDAVAPIRERVIELALREATVGDVRRAVAGVRALESALRYPSGMWDRPVPDEERDCWTPEFVRTIVRLGTATSAPDVDPAVIVAVRKTLNWHSSFSDTATRVPAQAVIRGLPDDLEHRLALMLHDGWGHLVGERGEGYETAQARLKECMASVVSELCQGDDAEIIAAVDRRLTVERYAFAASGHPGPLVAELVKARPSLAPLLIGRIVTDGTRGLQPLLPVVLAAYAGMDSQGALETARTLLETHEASASIKQGVAQAFAWNRGSRELAEGEMELLLALAMDPDSAVRRAPAVVAQRIAKVMPADARRLITAIDFADDPDLADEVFASFSRGHYGLSWDGFTAMELTIMRRRLVLLPDIGQYWITSFLSERSAVDPRWVIELLQDRVAHAEQLEILGDYRPMPFNWDENLRVRGHVDFEAHLRRLHVWIAEEPESWVRYEMGAEVFQEVAGRYDDTVLAVLREAIGSTNEADLRAVAAVLRKAHRTLIWDAPDFVADALFAGARFGDERLGEVGDALWAATISGSRMGSPGQPFPQDVEQRDRSKEIADRLPKGSLAEKFYRGMAASAERSIDRNFARGDIDDGRAW